MLTIQEKNKKIKRLDNILRRTKKVRDKFFIKNSDLRKELRIIKRQNKRLNDRVIKYTRTNHNLRKYKEWCVREMKVLKATTVSSYMYEGMKRLYEDSQNVIHNYREHYRAIIAKEKV
jgi:hypothetical protein